MTGRTWHALEVVVPPADLDLVSGCLAGHDVTGMEDGPDGSGLVVAFAERAWDVDAVRRELEGLTTPRLRTFTVEEEDWLALWKRSWRPSPLGRRLLVVPAWWSEPLPADRVVVRLDPGLAFGTGTHETTALAWEALEERLLADPPPRVLLDLGTGTGVLGLGAVALHPGVRVVATERDPQAIPTLCRDIALNGAAARVHALRADGVPLRAGCVDVAAVNLTAAEHRNVEAALVAALAPRATLILSGFLGAQFAGGTSAWAARGFRVSEVRVRGEWMAARFERS